MERKEKLARPEWASKSDVWFAWFPVSLGAFGMGDIVWLKKVWRNRCMGATIYQDLEGVLRDEEKLKELEEKLRKLRESNPIFSENQPLN